MPLFKLYETSSCTRVVEVEAKNKEEVLDIYYCNNDKDDEHDELMDDLNNVILGDVNANISEVKVKEIKTK
jgi:hypothetical protein